MAPPPAGLVLVALLALVLALALAPAPARGDKPARGGASSSIAAGAETEPSSAVFPLYGDVYPHGCVPSSALRARPICYLFAPHPIPPFADSNSLREPIN
jgi:hypothetical protein